MKYSALIAVVSLASIGVAPAYADPASTVSATSTPAAAKKAKAKSKLQVAETQKVTPSGEAIICKSQLETGSLVRKKKRCYTQAEWDRIAEAARLRGERLVTDHTGGTASN